MPLPLCLSPVNPLRPYPCHPFFVFGSRPFPSLYRLHLHPPSSPLSRLIFHTSRLPALHAQDPPPSLDVQIDDNDALTTVDIENIGNNSRRIVVSIPIDAPLGALWSVLTDYARLAEFIPGLSVCELQDRWDNGARLFQIGEQNLALGLKFKAKGIIDVHERPLKVLPSGICRNIDFEMIEGDFQIFKGTWQMEQPTGDDSSISIAGSSTQTVLTYVVTVQPKAWLPVRLVEGRLSSEIRNNLVCVRNEVLRYKSNSPNC